MASSFSCLLLKNQEDQVSLCQRSKWKTEVPTYEETLICSVLSFVLLCCFINFDLQIKTYNYFCWWVEKTVIYTNSCNLRLLHHQNPYHYQQSNLLLLLHWPSQVQKASSLSKMSWLIPDGATTLHNLRNAGSKLFHV